MMANSVQRAASHGGGLRTVLGTALRALSSDALVEKVKRGEIGMVSGIPDEHLRRRVFYSILILLLITFQSFNRTLFKWFQ